MDKDALILISNDDGVAAPGLRALRAAAAELGSVWVVAPDRERSAIGHAITLAAPLRVLEVEPLVFSVDGTPTDCIYLALHNILPRLPDLLLSGVNLGPNLGDDVTYSGTVAAAMEGALHHIPSLAISSPSLEAHHLMEAAVMAARVGREMLDRGLPPRVFLNLNVPPKATQIVVVRQGQRKYGRQVVRREDPRGRAYYWLGGAQIWSDNARGTDCEAMARGLASLTPLSVDLTYDQGVQEIAQWSVISRDGERDE